MGRMSAVLAHEIRTPIAVIFNALSALRHPEPLCPPAELHAIIAEEASRLRSVASEILDFARPGEPRLERVDLREVVEEAVTAAAQHPGLPPSVPRPIVELAEGLPPVRADHELLRRALVNLVVNAMTHVRPGGEIRITAERAEEGGVRLGVYNDGDPIPAEAARRIFEPFFTTRAQGMGLGLHVVRRALDACGGHVELDTTKTGVRFSAYLPAAAS
jgi:two-component system sensor histidine kinase HydH